MASLVTNLQRKQVHYVENHAHTESEYGEYLEARESENDGEDVDLVDGDHG